MELSRKPTPQEKKLLEFLVKKANLKLPSHWQQSLLVRPMKDGGMGSLSLFPNGVIEENRAFGENVSGYQFTDKDGVEVFVSLYVDSFGNLFELDVWKTDFSPLQSLPDKI